VAIRVCQVVASVNEFTGGPAWSVTGLSEALSKRGIRTHLCTLDYSHLGRQIPAPGVTLHSYRASFVTNYFRGLHSKTKGVLDELARGSLDIVHNHGLWMRPNVYARRSANRYKLPLVISPRGMLESWSLGYSWGKKQIAWHLYEHKNLTSAAMFHATSVTEVHSIRRLGFRQPIALIKNGVNAVRRDEIVAPDILVKKFPALAGKKWLLAMSRIHPKKGMESLLPVWQDLVPQFADWHLVIAGSDLIGYQAELEKLVTSLKLAEHVTFTGPLTGEFKQAALGNAELFVLPSHSENFGIVVAESLAHSVPVVTTRATPWQDLKTHHCGWWIDDNPTALKTALVAAMALDPQMRRDMGLRGRSLIEQKYSWSQVAAQMASVYNWLLSGGPVPDCIQ
jgi:glycosyltransferase involved in cell wall biosynthesis